MWEETDTAAFTVLPEKGKAITQFENQDEAWLHVAQGIQKAVKQLNSKR